MVARERTSTKADNYGNRKKEKLSPLSEPELLKQPEGFPPSTLKFLLHEAQYTLAHNNTQFGEGVTFHERIIISPVLPDPPTSQLEDRWVKWLEKFPVGSMVYCFFGRANTIAAALPAGFKERVEGRGIVDGGWMQQQLILRHPSVGSVLERENDGQRSEGRRGSREEGGGWVGGKESACKAVKLVMDEESEIGRETISKRLADRKVERFQKNVAKRGAVPETTTKKGTDYPVGPILLGEKR
ncbi:hypothetical protein GIB67_042293 [Kingdonia uniflora]|uniref:Uncharacterized protein n=1 Tax=Kingdonia uniflora TaxID=39325 RepID=A0A7J7LEB2_9MAGN|nr:hypothetical protein GIB67_042293 [Kingdonia uniflora]